MLLGRDMNKLEVEQLNGGNPAIDGRIWLDVGVVEHATHILCIHFNSPHVVPYYNKIGKVPKNALQQSWDDSGDCNSCKHVPIFENITKGLHNG
jgi:hypothetical protein